jgi:glycosyltransferase involved in cell wall biosynthesis
MKNPLHADRVILVSTVFDVSDVESRLGHSAYSYYFVYRAFKPLLERYCHLREISHPEAQLPEAAETAHAEGMTPIHLAFQPLEDVYLGAGIPVVAFPFWEFPDIPSRNLGNQPRENWLAASRNISGIVTACHFTKNAFDRAAFQGSIDVIPVPIQQAYFEMPAWNAREVVNVGCPWFELRQDEEGPEIPDLPLPQPATSSASLLNPEFLARRMIRMARAIAPGPTNFVVGHIRRAIPVSSAAAVPQTESFEHIAALERDMLCLSGIVFTSIFNPLDERKNWTDLVTAALTAFSDRPDVTLLFKLVVPPNHRLFGVDVIHKFYRQTKIRHACRFVIVSDYLSDRQMFDVVRGSTFYLNASKAEGECLPLQDFLASGRPALAPGHTAMQDYFDSDVGFVVLSSQEPTCWPRDPDKAMTTRWARIDWSSLYENVGWAYALATDDLGSYQRMADVGRQRMATYASADATWTKLNRALDRLMEKAGATHSGADRSS